MRRRVAEWKEERFEPLAGAEVLPRRASDIQEPDFGASVAKAVDQITKRTGHEGGRPPKEVPPAPQERKLAEFSACLGFDLALLA